ncbi:MAG: anti-sigma factor [Saprospiraceae bacterium]|nr:anti-sigma factor [Saprospiraceae bacterium]
MDIQSFIQSGILEAYVLGQCTAEERADVERMAAAHPAVRAELDSIEQSLEKIAFANAIEPPAGLKERILQQLPPSDAPLSSSAGGRAFRLMPLLGWAATALLAIALVGQWSRSGAEREQLSARVAELETKILECERQAKDNDTLRQVVALLNDSDARSLRLSDDVENPHLTANVWHNPSRCQVAIDINSLPVPPAGKYYQFWAIIDGKPVDMRMIRYQAAGGWQLLPCKGQATAYAISEEDKPEGNATPTKVVLVGAI